MKPLAAINTVKNNDDDDDDDVTNNVFMALLLYDGWPQLSSTPDPV